MKVEGNVAREVIEIVDGSSNSCPRHAIDLVSPLDGLIAIVVKIQEGREKAMLVGKEEKDETEGLKKNKSERE